MFYLVICGCSYECYWYSVGCDWMLYIYCSLSNLVRLVIVRLTLPPWSTLDVNLESMSITIMSSGRGGGGKLKRNFVLKLYIVSSRNVCNLGPLDVPFACKHARFACESKASTSGSKISNLECSTPPQAKAIAKLICPWCLPPHARAYSKKNPCI